MLASRVLFLLRKYGECVEFFATDSAFQEAREHLPIILGQRKVPVAPCNQGVGSRGRVSASVEREAYAAFEAAARQHIASRDENDWPTLASALALGCPIRAQDTDLFGCGVAAWTSDRVELYLAEPF
jgi:hypothetical protein